MRYAIAQYFTRAAGKAVVDLFTPADGADPVYALTDGRDPLDVLLDTDYPDHRLGRRPRPGRVATLFENIFYKPQRWDQIHRAVSEFVFDWEAKKIDPRAINEAMGTLGSP